MASPYAMDNEEAFLNQMFAAITEAEVISIFFPLLRRALVVDVRHDEGTPPMVRVMSQVSSMEERIASIERERPDLGKIRSMLGVPWLKSVRNLEDGGVLDSLVRRLAEAGMPPEVGAPLIRKAINSLWGIERLAFVSLIRGEGYKTLWTSGQ
ncbi:MAG: hypothetical protein WCD37_16310 [Chloroflexia bacterium]